MAFSTPRRAATWPGLRNEERGIRARWDAVTSFVLVASSQHVTLLLVLVLRAIDFRWHCVESQGGARGNHQSRARFPTRQTGSRGATRSISGCGWPSFVLDNWPSRDGRGPHRNNYYRDLDSQTAISSTPGISKLSGPEPGVASIDHLHPHTRLSGLVTTQKMSCLILG
jgi:hypothetical protein